MKLLNTIHEDYHMHSLNFSDGLNTVDEIVRFAWKIGRTKIAITDHSQKELDVDKIAKKNRACTRERRKNVHNDVQVIFGIEWDLLNGKGDCCFELDGVTSEFLILSCHEETYKAHNWDLQNMTQWYINAIERYHDKIKFIGHLCKKWTAEFVDVKRVVEVANKYHIPLEFNAGYLSRGWTNLEKLEILLTTADEVYINSDAHLLCELENRQAAFDYLKEKWFI